MEETAPMSAAQLAWARRVKAAQLCIDKFVGKPYEPGKSDCLRLFSTAVKAQGMKLSLAKVRSYSSEEGALRALRQEGYASLMAAVDAFGLPRIAPASALPGDIVALPAEEGNPFGCALTVSVSNGRVVGFQEIEGQGVGAVLQPLEYVAAWRVG